MPSESRYAEHLLLAFLPYHETPDFLRLMKIPLEVPSNSIFAFLNPLSKRRSSYKLNRVAIIKACCKSETLFKVLVKFNRNLQKFELKSKFVSVLISELSNLTFSDSTSGFLTVQCLKYFESEVIHNNFVGCVMFKSILANNCNAFLVKRCFDAMFACEGVKSEIAVKVAAKVLSVRELQEWEMLTEKLPLDKLAIYSIEEDFNDLFCFCVSKLGIRDEFIRKELSINYAKYPGLLSAYESRDLETHRLVWEKRP